MTSMAFKGSASEEKPAGLGFRMQEEEEEEEARSVRCECCGMTEDCTPTYISRMRERFHGRWVCGMCAEAVSELRRRDPALAVGEAVESHAKMCSEFNSTVRVNPTLYLARAMRDIARSRCHSRNNRSAPSAAPAAAPGSAGRKLRTAVRLMESKLLI